MVRPKIQTRKRGRKPEVEKKLKQLRGLSVFSAEAAAARGIPRATLVRMAKQGKVEKLGRGVYLEPGTELTGEAREYALACTRFGAKAAIGGMTALFHYGLIDEVPNRIWVLVPPEVRSAHKLYRVMRVRSDLRMGIREEGFFRIVTLERAVVEAFRYTSIFGVGLAVKAARRALEQKMTTEQKILNQAREFGFEHFVLDHWEAFAA